MISYILRGKVKSVLYSLMVCRRFEKRPSPTSKTKACHEATGLIATELSTSWCQCRFLSTFSGWALSWAQKTKYDYSDLIFPSRISFPSPLPPCSASTLGRSSPSSTSTKAAICDGDPKSTIVTLMTTTVEEKDFLFSNDPPPVSFFRLFLFATSWEILANCLGIVSSSQVLKAPLIPQFVPSGSPLAGFIPKGTGLVHIVIDAYNQHHALVL